jgi:hypothetical protein
MSAFRIPSPQDLSQVGRNAIQALKEYVDNQDQYRVCTSTTRPTGVKGLSIYETDTNRQWTHDGTGWVIMSEPTNTYTPTLTRITLGNGGITGTYRRSDGYCDWTVRLDFGTTTTMGSNPLISAPVNSFNGWEWDITPVELYNPGGRFYGVTYAANFSQVGLIAYNSAGTYAIGATVESTVPFTWGNGCVVLIAGRYRMTTRYS